MNSRLTHQDEGISLIKIPILLKSYESIRSCVVLEANFAHECRHNLKDNSELGEFREQHGVDSYCTKVLIGAYVP
jgi:hypothetical protein